LLSSLYIDPSAPSLVLPPLVLPSSNSWISHRSTVQLISPSDTTVGRHRSYTDDSIYMTDQLATSSEVMCATAGGGHHRHPRDSHSLSATPEPVVIQLALYTPVEHNRCGQSYDSYSPQEPTVIQMMLLSKGRYRCSQQVYIDGGCSPPVNQKSVIIQSDWPELTEEESLSHCHHDSPVMIILQPGLSSKGTYTALGCNH
jgi:hypothetical protein